ncbi:conserved hypothetical protein [Chryseobacterium sp. 8AT]|nr:conserved hypothetical protein [Chryseobacterium sp. 8AT]
MSYINVMRKFGCYLQYHKFVFQMRYPLFLLILFLIFSCEEKPELKMDIKTVKTNLNLNNNRYLKEYHPEKIGQEVEIQFVNNNNNNNNKLYGIMSCSYNSNFVLDNKDFSFETFRCDSNFPVYVHFENNISEKYKLLVAKNPKSKSNYFKIGFKKIIFPNKYYSFESFWEKVENKKYEILWSEPIKFEN